MATNFPSSLDSSTQQPTIASSDEMDDSGKEHDVVHTNHSGAIIALETKLGTGDSNAVADAVLMGTGSGTSGWDTSPTFKGAVTVGVDDTGHDVKFFGATSGSYMLWDESADALIVNAGPIFATAKMQTGQSSFTQEPWNDSTIALGAFGSIGTQGSYRTTMAWNFERGTDSAWHHLDINSLPQAGAVEIGSTGIIFRWQADFETDHADLPTDVLLMDADALYPADNDVTDLGTTAKKFQLGHINYVYGTQGSASYPAYVFDGDNNTGMWSSGDDTINWSTAGVERGELQSDGDWFFGTSSQHVRAQPTNNDRLLLYENGTGRPYISFWNRLADGSVDRKGYMGYPEATSDTSNIYIRSDDGYVDINNTKLTGNTYINGTGCWLTNYGDVLKIDNADGYTHIGAMNANGTHIYSELARVYIGMYNAAYYFANTGAWMPITDDARNLGYSSSAYRWDNIYATSGTVNISDQRDKTDIVDIDLGLDFVKSLRPVNYRWNMRSGYEGTRTHMGFISQEVATALGNEASNRGVWINNPEETADVDGMGEKTFPEGQGLRYHQLIAPIVKAIQELEARVASLEG